MAGLGGGGGGGWATCRSSHAGGSGGRRQSTRSVYSTAVDDKGETLYVTWNVNRAGKAWDCVAVSAIHIPPSER